jgi:hypothetical protein
MKELSFYDLRKKKKFNSDKYSYLSKKNPKTGKTVYMVKCKSPWGNEAYRIVSKEDYKK